MSRQSRSLIHALGKRAFNLARFLGYQWKRWTSGTGQAGFLRPPRVCVNDGARDKANAVSRRNYTELQVHGGKIPSNLFEIIPKLEGLQKVELRYIQTAGSAKDFNLLSDIMQLDELKMDGCHSTFSASFGPMRSISNFERLSLPLADIDSSDSSRVAVNDADLTLKFHGRRDLGALEWLKEVPNLVHITVEDFGELDFPVWMLGIHSIRSLAFVHGSLSLFCDQVNGLTESLTRLIMCCNFDAPLLSSLLSLREKVPELKIAALPCSPSDEYNSIEHQAGGTSRVVFTVQTVDSQYRLHDF